MRPVLVLLALSADAHADPEIADPEIADPETADPETAAPVALTPPARATGLRAVAKAGESADDALDRDVAGPFLRLDTAVPVTIDRLDRTVDRFERRFQLGGGARVAVQTEWHSADHGVPVRGWRTAVTGAYDIGGLTLTATSGVEHVDTELGRGSLLTSAVRVGRAFRLSRSVRGWVGLSLGFQHWLGKPLPGEANSIQATVSAKLTY
jgi:hypothetical protein